MSPGSRPAVFFDRDGVINEAVLRNGNPHPPASRAEIRILTEVFPALGDLKKAGFFLIVITNQPDVARGTQTKEEVEAIHSYLVSQLPIGDILVCYHDDRDDCPCRKPKPGLILQASAKHSIDLSSSFVIGDRWKDIEAGQRAGCQTIFLDLHYAEGGPTPPADLTVSSLSEAVPWILQKVERK
jgi:D-glycero-D-manno-heptose 1,7-bisphosphate phosphatase